jgi:2-polyprenyl-3-methyl-5-hydroxy-6-metoxy-1,4-benzoquinol methylase
MIYFSDKHVNVKEVDTDQINELMDFRKKCERCGIISNFKGIDEFKRKLSQHIDDIAPKLLNGTFKKGNKIIESSYYYKGDSNRLVIQAESLLELNRENIKDAISNIRKFNSKKTIKVLDVGCANGYVTHSNFNEIKDIQVVGIDKSKAAIEEAKKDYGDKKFSFRNEDIEDVRFYPERCDLIFCSFVLHHLAKPESILHKLWSALNPHGCLIVNTIDDGTIINYPQNDDLNWLIQKTNELKGSPNRLHGREIYNHLMSLNPEPERVEMKFDVLSTANMSKEDRLNYFLECHSFRVDYAERAANMPDSTDLDKKLFERFKRITDEQKKRFINEKGLFALEVTPITIAYKA